MTWFASLAAGVYGYLAVQEATSEHVPYPDWLRPYELVAGAALIAASIVVLAWRGGDE